MKLLCHIAICKPCFSDKFASQQKFVYQLVEPSRRQIKIMVERDKVFLVKPLRCHERIFTIIWAEHNHLKFSLKSKVTNQKRYRQPGCIGTGGVKL